MHAIAQHLLEIGNGIIVHDKNNALEKRGVIQGLGIEGNYSLLYPLTDNLLGNNEALENGALAIARRIVDLAAEKCKDYEKPIFVFIFGAKNSQRCIVKLSVIDSRSHSYWYTYHCMKDSPYLHQNEDCVRGYQEYKNCIDPVKHAFISGLQEYCESIGINKDIVFEVLTPFEPLEKILKENNATPEEKTGFVAKLNQKIVEINCKITDLTVIDIQQIALLTGLHNESKLKEEFLKHQKEYRAMNKGALNAKKIQETTGNPDVDNVLDSAIKESQPLFTLKKLSLISLGSLNINKSGI